MTTAIIQNNQELIIDKDILEIIGLKSGDKVRIDIKNNKLEVKPLKTKSLSGFLKGYNIKFEREEDRI